MRHCFCLLILCGLYLAGGSLYAQGETQDSSFTNKQLRDKSVYRQKTTLGVFTIGSHGLIKDEREQAKTGDLEIGRVFEFKSGHFIPRVLELETFLINRLGTYEDSVYESLGLGAGSQLNYRKTGQFDKWFLRFAAIKPTEYYMERYGAGAEQTVYELTVGRKYSIAPVTLPGLLRQRLAFYTLAASVPASALEDKTWSNANAAAFMSSYLAAHYQQVMQTQNLTYADMSDFEFIIQRSGVSLSEHEARLLELHQNSREISDAWQGTFRVLFRRAITILLRDKCMLTFNVREAQTIQAFSLLPDGVIEQDNALDPDRMIETYLTAMWQKFKVPAE